MIIAYNRIVPTIGSNVFIAPTAVVIGDVTIGDGASIWFNAVLRGDMAPIRIGANTNIQDNCTVHTDFGKPAVVGDNVTVGHNAVVHGCTIEDICLIGIASVVLNDAIIKTGSVVAAGSVVREGQVVGPNQLLAGSPATVKRELDATRVAKLKAPAQRYANIKSKYLKK